MPNSIGKDIVADAPREQNNKIGDKKGAVMCSVPFLCLRACLLSSDDLQFLVRREGLEIVETIGRRGGNFVIIVARKPL